MMLSAPSLASAFFSGTKIGHSNECWPWLMSRNPQGYGKLKFRSRDLRAHRVSFELHNGEIGAGLVVRHRCNNPCCVNPNHLAVGTPKQNTADMIAQGRQIEGRQVTIAKLRARPRCKHGHSYAQTGFYRAGPTGFRLCRECARLKNAVARAKRKAEL